MKASPRIVVIGSLNIDVVVEAERMPRQGETVMGTKAHVLPGGKGANQAVALGRLGAETAMIGCVGKDAFGEQSLRGLREAGVRTDRVKMTEEAPTGTAQIVLAQGDNRIIVVPGANDWCKPADIERCKDVIAWADAVLLQLEIPLDTAEAAVRAAVKHGKRVFLNPAPVRPLTDSLLRRVDVLTPNETELAELAGMPLGEGGGAVERAMQALLNRGVRRVVTTLGASGAIYRDEQGMTYSVKGHAVDIADTTGAGDCFNAGLAYELASGKEAPQALAFANQAAALAVTRLGAQAGMPTLAEIEAHFG